MKKLLLVLSIIGVSAFASNISGPRYRVELAVGAMDFKNYNNLRTYKSVSNSISLLQEWKVNINKKFDITFGPKGTLNVETNFYMPNIPVVKPSAILGGEVDFNYKVKNNVKLYASVEAGVGLGFRVFVISDDNHVHGPEITSISKVALGIKLDEKVNLALYTGNVKGILGLEVGYTF
ncbi:hypothetical protein [Streptobacillus ratti]|uniref:hypothetical protein n=1 Tax=Streptobacillus ratti TaxID=1720557 RepID=UPI0009352E3E|nr:hypothetical protein [Streptobacillus ratti]